MTGVFGDRCFFIEEMPVAKGSTGLHFLKDDELQIDRVEYGIRVLAATYLMSQCKALINCTGNMALWMTFYRGHTNEMYQFDENAVCSDPLGRNFSDNFFVRGYRFLKNKYQKSSRKCAELFARGACDVSIDKSNLKANTGATEWWMEAPIYFYPNDGRFPRAHAHDNFGRFREIVSDPLNLLIERVPEAGYVQDGIVTLHNGVKVPFSGAQAYYEGFSSIFIINRGVHEPLEEFVFQRMLQKLPDDARMIELGAYWGHYSMWFKKMKSAGQVVLVEPELNNLEVGRSNFLNNGLDGEFIQSFVGHGHFALGELMDLLAKLSGLLTNDTGTMHLADFIGTPLVAIFGSTEPSLTGPRGPRSQVIRQKVECSPCFLRECPIDFRCMEEIPIEKVVAAVLNFCKKPQPASNRIGE